jgi:tetratricopeptide (TPR) repeat protein
VLEDWHAALRRIERTIEVKRAMGRPERDIAGNRFNRANVLTEFSGHLGEARAELEALLDVYAGDPARSSSVLSSLANLFNRLNDIPQAVELERRALALREQLPDPRDRAISHNNLAIYLNRIGTPAALAESARHQPAALAHRLAAGLGHDLQTSLRNYAIRFRCARARAAGIDLAVPRLAELLADPAFRPLGLWLDQRGVDRAELQQAIDQALDQARQRAEQMDAEPDTPPAAPPEPSASPLRTLGRAIGRLFGRGKG